MKLSSIPLPFFLISLTVFSLALRASDEIGDGGPATEAKLTNPAGVALDGRGNLYIADTGAHRIRRVDGQAIITTVAGVGRKGFTGDGGPAAQAETAAPHDIVFDSVGNLYFTDSYNHRIRKVDRRGIISTVAGTGKAAYSGDGGPAIEAHLNVPQGITIDREGNLLIADTFNHVIRKIDGDGIITLVAGSHPWGYAGDGGPAPKALLSVPSAIQVTPDGTIYFSDSANSRIRKIDPTGIIHHWVGFPELEGGTYGAGFAGDSGPADKARIYTAAGIAFDSVGNLHISDSGNNRIRMVIRNSVIATIAGTGEPGFSGDGGKAIEARISSPKKLVLDQEGNIYLADQLNHRIRKIDSNGVISTVAGSGAVSDALYQTASR